MLQSYFDFQGDAIDQYWAVCAAVDRLAVDRYRDYKLKAHNHLKAHIPSRHMTRCLQRTSRSALTSSPVLLSCYNKLVELRETQETHVASSGTLLDERALQRRFSENDEDKFMGLDGFRRAHLPP
ncbi:hypothetical protein Adt_47528 [Abeliophyllum distichum]|uniref:Uncharacterized protein n=1 Tax=Abeliophyllum distichum TaxID=126358 RepID=A0ABD1NTS3_9LAMI